MGHFDWRGLRVGGHLALSLHSSNEPGELLQWPNPHHNDSIINIVISFRVRRSRGEMYSGHGRLCVCVYVSVCSSPHSHITARTGCKMQIGGMAA